MNLSKKSRVTSFILTLIFGPLGLFYSSVAGGIVLVIVAIISSVTIVGIVLCWIAAIIWGDYATRKHNASVSMLVGGAAQGSTVQAANEDAASHGAQPVEQVRARPEGKTTIMGISPIELVVYASLVAVVVFGIPMLLGKEPDESALHFYIRFFENPGPFLNNLFE